MIMQKIEEWAVISAALVTSRGQKNEASTISRESAYAVQRSDGE
jgi:hypothetical protein